MADLVKKVWKGSSRPDKVKFGQFDQATILAGNGNDRVELAAVQGGLIDLGANNDYLSIFSFFSADNNQLVTTIDGGSGTDTLNLSALSTTGLKWLFEAGKGWHVSDLYEFALVKNIETVIFEDNVRMALTMKGTATITGTSEADTIEATINASTRVTVNAGAGDDFITLNGTGGNFSSTLSLIDGGAGNDTLEQQGNQSAYRLVQSRSGWYLQTKDGSNSWNFAARLVNVENVVFSDGSTIGFGQTGISNTAGTGASTLIGTSGDDTFKGSAGNDSFVGLGGNDVFDLRAGGSDIIDLADIYAAGLTEVTVIGRKADDTFYIPSGETIISDNRSYNSSGIQVGDIVLQWARGANLVVHFSTS